MLLNLLLLTILTLPLPCLADAPRQLPVGVIVPLTGSVALAGQSVKNSMLLAKREHDPSDRVAFFFEDDSYIARNSITAANKLLNVNGVKVLVVFGSSASLAIAPIVEQKQIPMVSISTAERIAENRDYVVRHWLDASSEFGKLNSEITRRGYETIVVLTTLNDGLLPLKQGLLDHGSARVLFTQDFDPVDSDFRSITSRIKALSPSAVGLILTPPQAGIVARQLRQQGYTGELFGCHTIEIDDEINRPDSALRGAWYVTADDTAAGSFRERYREAFGAEPVVTATNGYDIAKMLIEAAQSGDVNKYLHTVKNFEGVLGKYGANGRNGFTVAAVMKTICGAGRIVAGSCE